MPRDREACLTREDRLVDEDDFRAAFATVATSVAVVTARDEADVLHGMTVSSLCALSRDPPLLLFCVGRDRRCHAALCNADRVCVSVLAQGQESTARRFAAQGERFTGDLAELDGLPAIPGAMSWLLCGHERVVPAGDHSIVIARVQEAHVQERRPLVYWQRAYRPIRVADPDSSPAAAGELVQLRAHGPEAGAVAKLARSV
jgi:flavin reductase ActVB